MQVEILRAQYSRRQTNIFSKTSILGFLKDQDFYNRLYPFQDVFCRGFVFCGHCVIQYFFAIHIIHELHKVVPSHVVLWAYFLAYDMCPCVWSAVHTFYIICIVLDKCQLLCCFGGYGHCDCAYCYPCAWWFSVCSAWTCIVTNVDGHYVRVIFVIVDIFLCGSCEVAGL